MNTKVETHFFSSCDKLKGDIQRMVAELREAVSNCSGALRTESSCFVQTVYINPGSGVMIL